MVKDLFSKITGPHEGQQVYTTGKRIENARAAMVMLHGRGATAGDILSLAAEFDRPDFVYLAPQAADGTWYPSRFLDPTSSNEPWLSSALAQIERILAHLKNSGMPPEKTILLGFSQGACLALEYAARNARRYGGLAGLSGGLIGAGDEKRQDKGYLDGAPVFLGCSDADPHIPKERVMHAAEVLRGLGGEVTVRLYPDMAHTINNDEIEAVRDLMDQL